MIRTVTLAAQRPGHRGLPLRVLIAGLFVGLLAAAGVAGVGYGYVVTSRLLLSAGDEEFLHVAERTAGQVRDLLAPRAAPRPAPLAPSARGCRSPAARLDSLPLLTTALNEHPEISAVYVGSASGEFLLARCEVPLPRSAACRPRPSSSSRAAPPATARSRAASASSTGNWPC